MAGGEVDGVHDSHDGVHAHAAECIHRGGKLGTNPGHQITYIGAGVHAAVRAATRVRDLHEARVVRVRLEHRRAVQVGDVQGDARTLVRVGLDGIRKDGPGIIQTGSIA
jgi:hypothetical protein